MLRKLVRLLPYGLVMYLLRKDYGIDGFGTLKIGDSEHNSEYKICYYQISAGEFVCYSQELQEAFEKRKKERRDSKLDKRIAKLDKQLDRDFFLERRLREQFEDESLDDMVICRKCGKEMPSDNLILLHVIDENHIQACGATPIMRPNGVVTPCCHALWDYVCDGE